MEVLIDIFCNRNSVIITPDNSIHDNGGHGLYLIGNNINLSGFNTDLGRYDSLYVQGDNINLSGFTIYNNGQNGIYVSGNNFSIQGNTVTGNGVDGISVFW